MSNILYNLPDQTIPETKKTKEWHMDHVRDYIKLYGGTFASNMLDEIESLYRSYLCVMNDEEKKLIDPVIKPYGSSLGVEYIIYNLVEQKVEQLIGDYMDRPKKRKAYVMNKDAVNRKLDAKINTMVEDWFREKNEEFEKEHGISLDTENPELEIPEDIEEFFSKKYKDIAEEVSDDLMEKFLEVDKQNREIIPTLRDFLIADQCHIDVYEENGIVKWQKSHPLDVGTDRDPHKEVQDDHEYFRKLQYLTENEIYNTYELDEKQKAQLKADFAYMQNSTGSKSTSASSAWMNDKGWFLNDNGNFRLAVVKMSWKSRKTLRVKVSKNKHTGDDIYKMLNDKDRAKKSDKLITHSFETERFVVAAGPNVCLDYGMVEDRNYRISDKKKTFLNSVSLYRQNSIGVGTIRSVPAKLYKLQAWASEQLFELRLATRRNQGRVLVYDTAQIPKQYLKGGNKSAYSNALNRVMHHAKKDQMIFINSKDRNNKFNFNQFTSVDLSTSGLINDIIAGMSLIEDLADKMIGLTPERQGNVEKYSTATGTEASRKASFSRTEIFYRPFDDFLQTAMERVTHLSKKVYKKGDLIHYVLGDMKTKWLHIAEEFSDTDIGWYLADGSKDQKKKQIVDQAAQLALGNAQTEEMILSLIDVLSSDTAVESKAILERAVAASAKLREENSRAEQEQFGQQLQQKQAAVDKSDETVRRGQDKNVDIARIYADNKEKTTDKTNTKDLLINLAKFEQEQIKKYQNN